MSKTDTKHLTDSDFETATFEFFPAGNSEVIYQKVTWETRGWLTGRDLLDIIERVTTHPAEWSIVPGPDGTGEVTDIGEARFFSHGEEFRARVMVKR